MSPMIRLLILVFMSLGLLVLTLEATGNAEEEVDLSLVLAVDVSGSIEPEEQELQRQGFVEAFRSAAVHRAIREGMLGRIAVVYVEWSGKATQNVVVPWVVIESAHDATEFAERLARSPMRRLSYTSISGAIDFSLRLLRENRTQALRQVIDISGDGANNDGRPVTQARNEAVSGGITINGLPIMLKRASSSWDTENLDAYFRDCVIGGPGAFIVPVRERDHFAAAIRRKLIREIAGRAVAQPLVKSTQAQDTANCLAGEMKLHQNRGPWSP